MAEQIMATGRRKTSVARVCLKQGSGKFIINGKDINDYFSMDTLKMVAKQPLALLNLDGKYDISVNVYGGGFTGQAGAIRHGLSRALVLSDINFKKEIKKAGFLTRDSRMIERKKYGLKKARKAPQFSKR